MHDTQLPNLTGWPDVESAPSIVRCIKQSATISAPSGVSGNWDCHIFAWPWVESNAMWNADRDIGNNVLAASAAPTNVNLAGGVSAYGCAAGATMIPGASSTTTAANLFLNPSYTQGAGRLIGMGIEVVNTTSDLYKQGLCTVYRVPQPHSDSTAFTTTTGPGAGAVNSFSQVRGPPSSTAQAMLYSGSRQWKASEGSYQVISFVGQDNPPLLASYNSPLVNYLDDVAGTNGGSAPNLTPVQVPMPIEVFPVIGGGGTAYSTGVNVMPATRMVPLHSSGAVYSGLSNQTTLNLNVNMYYESFPGISEQDILVLAKPSAQYDPIALELLSNVLNTMPVGVESSMNAAGDWFADIIDTLASFAAPIGMAFGGPAGGALGAAIGQGAKSLTPHLRTVAPAKQRYLAPPAMSMRGPPPIPKKGKTYRAQADLVRAEQAARDRQRAKRRNRKKKQK